MYFEIRIELEKLNVSLIKDDSIRFLMANSRKFLFPNSLSPNPHFVKRLLQLA